MKNYKRNIAKKAIALQIIGTTLVLWIVFSLLKEQINSFYFLAFLFFIFAIPTIDQISIDRNEVQIERFYFYSLLKRQWIFKDRSKYYINLYSSVINDRLPETFNPWIDFLTMIIPFRYKSQGIIVQEKWVKRKSLAFNFGLFDQEYSLISKILKDDPHSP